MIRAFIALTISDGLQKYLSDVVSNLSKLDIRASWTKPGNFHLTLKFLGDIEEKLVPELSKKLSEIETDFPVGVKLSEISGFPNIKNPRILWCGIKDDISKQLFQRIQNICEGFGFEKEKKPFRAHLTLGRIKSFKPIGLEDVISEIPMYNEKCFFTGIALIKSELTRNGPIYTNLWKKD